jgi:oligopeptide transport system ATP-binding protein
MSEILKVNDLNISFKTRQGEVPVVKHVNFTLEHNKSLGLIGESGSGKTLTCLSIIRLLPPAPTCEAKGNIYYNNMDLLQLKEQEMQKIRGNKIAMIFQDPVTALNPTRKVGPQLIETLTTHQTISYREAKNKSLEMLSLVGVSDVTKRLKQYPHQLSRGLCQRIMIAMALLCRPEILIADEPTSALDATITIQILKLIQTLKEKLSMSLLFVSHDLHLVTHLVDAIAVMYAGQIVETAPPGKLFRNPKHPYTIGLTDSLINIDQGNSQSSRMMKKAAGKPLKPTVGCPFEPRCPRSQDVCKQKAPQLLQVDETHQAACFSPAK